MQAIIKNHKCPTATKVTEVVTSKASVFFNIGKSRIASKKDLVNVQELVKCAKANGKTIVVTGYADSKTGTASYNQTLSEKRAKTVADELLNMGVSRDKIEIVANDMVWLEELVAIADAGASSPVFGLLKRPDEKFVTEMAYDNPRFVEDAVREIALRLEEDSRISWYRCEVESVESIHNHNAFAVVEKGWK